MEKHHKITDIEDMKKSLDRSSMVYSMTGKPLNPRVLRCTPEQDCRKLFDSLSVDYSYIDALSMTRKELRWTDYGDINAQSDWYKKLLETKVLIIDNFSDLPEAPDSEERHGDDRPTQNDYRFLFYNMQDTTPNRVGANYEIPLDAVVYIIERTNSQYSTGRIYNNFSIRPVDISEIKIPEDM